MRILGLDLGTRTCGVAMSDPSAFLASPLITVRFADADYQDALTQVVDLAKEHQVQNHMFRVS